MASVGGIGSGGMWVARVGGIGGLLNRTEQLGVRMAEGLGLTLVYEVAGVCITV
jgi:hypothetical protein